jgi:flagellar hook-length control protein FliK
LQPLRKDLAMSEINVVAAPVVNGSTSVSNAASADAGATNGATNPFAAILQQQMADPVSQALLVAKTNLSLANADPPPDALNTLLPALLGKFGLVATTGSDHARPSDSTTAKDKSDTQDTPGTPVADLLMALPITVPVTPTTGVTSAAGTPNTQQNAANTALPLPTLFAGSTANLAAAPEVIAAATTAAQPAAKEAFETLLAASADARAQATVAQAHAAPAPSSNAVPARVDSAVGSSAWNNDVGDRMVWMANQGQSRAELVLTPPQLGRIEISLSMSGNQANAVFISANPEVREALENAMPRLREILADAGVTLGQTQVGADSSGQSTNGRENGDNSSSGRSATAFVASTTSAALAAGATNPWLKTGRGLVDVFA